MAGTPEVDGVFGRRDAIVQFFKRAAAASLFDLPPRGAVVH